MTKQESIAVLEAIGIIQRADIKVVAKYIYTDNGADTVPIKDFSPREMAQLLTRAVYQLQRAISDGDWRILPFKSNGQNEDLASILRRIASQLSNGNPFEQWVDYLVLLIQYEKQNGIWESAGLLSDSELESLKIEARKLSTDLGERLNELAAVKEFIDRRREEIEIIYEQSQIGQQESHKLNSNSNSIIKELRQVELEFASNNGRAIALLEQLTISSESAQKTIEQERSRFSQLAEDMVAIHRDSSIAVGSLSKFDDDFNNLIQSAKDKEKHILDQKDEIAKLRGFAADIALGSVFGERQKELQETVKLWRTVSFVAIGVAIVWIVFVFWEYKSQTLTGVNWLILLANVVRTSPAFLLVYFCLDRYTKERNIQEEYAFKAAVSMTITAYAEMIKDEPERVKMLVSTVQGVYTPPVLGKPFKPVSLNSKHLADSGKSVAEAVKNVKEMIGDVTKVAKSSDK